MPSGTGDKYANILQENVVTSGADTLTFQELDIGLSLFDKVGLLLHRIQFDPNNNYMTEMNAEGDRVRIGLTQSNTITALTIGERAVIDVLEKDLCLAGAGVSSWISDEPFMLNYSDLPGGGILVAPKPLYLAVDTDGFAGTLSITMRMYFTIVKLKPEEYFELLEARRFFG